MREAPAAQDACPRRIAGIENVLRGCFGGDARGAAQGAQPHNRPHLAARRAGVPNIAERRNAVPAGQKNQRFTLRRTAKVEQHAAQASPQRFTVRRAAEVLPRPVPRRRPCHKNANKKGSKPFGPPPHISMAKTIYSLGAPTPGNTCSKAWPSASSSPSAKALPNNCMPTGMPLSAPRPTGMESPGSPARLSESV